MNVLRLILLKLSICLVSKVDSTPRIKIFTTTLNTSAEIAGIAWQGPYVDLGMAHLNDTYGDMFHFSHTWIAADPRRSVTLIFQDDVENLVAKFYYQNIRTADVMALLAGSSRDFVQSTHLTKALNVFQMSGLGNGINQRVAPNFISLSARPNTAFVDFCGKFLLENHYTSIASLIDLATFPRIPSLRAVHDSFTQDFGKGLYASIKYQPFYCDNILTKTSVVNTLSMISGISRVVFFFGITQRVRSLMIAAHRQQLTNGDYLFIFITYVKGKLPDPVAVDYNWRKGSDDDEQALEAYKALVVVSIVDTPQRPPSSRAHVVEMYANKYNLTFANDTDLNGFIATYEMFVLYGIVLNESYSNGLDISDGRLIAHQMLNRTFRLPIEQIYIDPLGERTGVVLVEQFNATAGMFQSIATFDGRTKSIITIRDGGQLWSAEWPPPNEPTCGYLGNRCIDEERRRVARIRFIIVGVPLASALLVVVGVWYLMRVYQPTHNWWRIDGQSLGVVTT